MRSNSPDEGEVPLEINTFSLGNEKWEIHLKITDTGIGIPKENLDRLFSHFT